MHKDILIAAAWTLAVVVLPVITGDRFPVLTAFIGGAYVFVLVFSKVTILAIGGQQSDKLVGLETIPVLIGKKNTERLLYVLNLLLALVFILFASVKLLPVNTLILLVPILYMVISIILMSREGFFFRMYHLLILDADFFLAGVLAYAFLR